MRCHRHTSHVYSAVYKANIRYCLVTICNFLLLCKFSAIFEISLHLKCFRSTSLQHMTYDIWQKTWLMIEQVFRYLSVARFLVYKYFQLRISSDRWSEVKEELLSNYCQSNWLEKRGLFCFQKRAQYSDQFPFSTISFGPIQFLLSRRDCSN